MDRFMPLPPSLRHELLGARKAIVVAQIELRSLRIALALKRFNPSQPRAPAGSPNGGQWVGEGAPAHPSEKPRSASENSSGITLAGGFEQNQLGMRVQDFVSAHCKGKIRSVLPGQFLGVTIEDVMKAAKGGDSAARTCLKILGRDEYRK
ncbi:hypothetical protein AB4072_08510 [Microvirga sp. 2MCAF38]|uniref:hypothetical protein n=1 Tax=Microvirga sp. 2MCAF38 TaxID=3232989 RepID=UPI003F9480CE